MDLSATFDTTDHDILHERLSRSFGIVKVPLAWISSYLTEQSRHDIALDHMLWDTTEDCSGTTAVYALHG